MSFCLGRLLAEHGKNSCLLILNFYSTPLQNPLDLSIHLMLGNTDYSFYFILSLQILMI